MNNHFEITETSLDGLVVIKRKQMKDDRGFFSRLFCDEELRHIGLEKPVVQINHTLTAEKGAVRGLHFQHPPYSEIKIVSCLRGKVFDVAVDFRRNSPTFLRWHAELLSAENQTTLFIPEGFAHGFQAQTENCELLYLHTSPYAPSFEGALNVTDPSLNISWPLPISELSERDRLHPMIGVETCGIKL